MPEPMPVQYIETSPATSSIHGVHQTGKRRNTLAPVACLGAVSVDVVVADVAVDAAVAVDVAVVVVVASSLPCNFSSTRLGGMRGAIE